MKYLNEHELKVLKQYSAGLISKEELEQIIIHKATDNEIEYMLDKCIISKNSNDFEAIFWGIPKNLNKVKEVYLCGKYLLLEGHFEHENIVLTFQTFFNDNKENIQILLKAIEKIPKYISNNNPHSYIRKIIYAIGAQPEPYNLVALEKIVNETQEKTIKELALHQIDKRKRLGRWEYEKNKLKENGKE